jgi:hypothetical protein
MKICNNEAWTSSTTMKNEMTFHSAVISVIYPLQEKMGEIGGGGGGGMCRCLQ